MFQDTLALVKIFQGNPVQEPSEKHFLHLLLSDLEAAKSRALIFVNFFAGPRRRQIDALIITRSTVCLVEVKGYSLPVRGKANGPWEQRRFRDGEYVWEKMDGPNGYSETLDHKMALSDAMHQFAREKLSNPPERKAKYYQLFHACLCIVPDIPCQSDLPESDYKVVTLGYRAGFETLLGKPLKPSWTLEHWQEFAQWLSLQPVSSGELLNQPTATELPLEEYQRKFSYHQRSHWIPTTVLSREKSVGAEPIKDLLRSGRSCVILGPSGMGKSCLAQEIVADIGRSECLVIKLRALYYRGIAHDTLSDSVERYGPWTLNQLLAHAEAQGIRCIILVDGWNECNSDLRDLLAQQLDKMVNRQSAALLMTSQFIPREICSELESFQLGPLQRAEKLAIANLDSKSDHSFSCLLDAVSTGMDARIVGETSGIVRGNESRAELFDLFVRNRLAAIDDISPTIFDALVVVAAYLHSNLSGSLSVSQMHILIASFRDPGLLVRLMQESGLLSTDPCRCYAAFAHEQYQHFFAAWGLARDCGDIKHLVDALQKPRNLELRTFVLGLYGMDKSSTDISKILSKLTAAETLADCLDGQCGRSCQMAVQELIDTTFQRLAEEISELSFAEEKRSEIGWGINVWRTSRSWTAHDRAVFRIMGRGLEAGIYLDEFLLLARLMDGRLLSESDRLARVDGDRAKIFERLFPAAHVFGHGDAPGFTCALNEARPCRMTRIPNEPRRTQSQILALLRQPQSLSPGQLYLVLDLARNDIRDWDGALLETMPALIAESWHRGPYHLQLEIMELLQLASGCSSNEPLKKTIAEELKDLFTGNLFLNTAIFEALSSLVELESLADEEEYYVHIHGLLSKPHDKRAQETAWALYNRQFDDTPDSLEIFRAIDRLDSDQKGIFLLMAARGKKADSFFESSLLMELCSLLPRGAQEIFRRFCVPPKAEETGLVQERTASFLWAIVGLARSGVDFPKYGPQTEDLATWWDVAELFYWMNHLNQDVREKEVAIRAVWNRIIHRFHIHSWGIVSYVLRFLCRSASSLSSRFELALLPRFSHEIRGLAAQEIALFLLRNANEGNNAKKPFWEWTADPIGYAIGILGDYGVVEDKEILMRVLDNPSYGEQVVGALRQISHRDRK